MKMIIRCERPDEYRAVEELTREAFWGQNHPDCDEHYLAHRLRQSPGFISGLDFVAEADGKLIGNVMFSKSKIVDPSGKEYETINFGPLSVLPGYQAQGVGKALMGHAVAEAKRLGFRAILFYGHPDYYPRLGFRRAVEFGITTSNGENFDAFMAMELCEGSLRGISGKYYEDPAFEIDPSEAEAYDRQFPMKGKAVLVPIDVLLDRLDASSREAIGRLDLEFLCKLRQWSQKEIADLPGVTGEAIMAIKRTMMENGYRWGEKEIK